jgi:hypothetical protein
VQRTSQSVSLGAIVDPEATLHPVKSVQLARAAGPAFAQGGIAEQFLATSTSRPSSVDDRHRACQIICTMFDPSVCRHSSGLKTTLYS